MSTIQIRIWESEKLAAQELFAKFWMNLSSAFKTFISTSIQLWMPALTFSNPVELTKNWFTKEFEKNIIKEIKLAEKNWKKYNTTEEAFSDILWTNWK